MVKRVIQNSIAFAAKYRRKVFFGEKRREIVRTLCDWKRLKVIEAEVCPGHIHMRIGMCPERPDAVRKASGTEMQIPK